MSVIATQNIKDKNIFNTMEFTINEIDFQNHEFLIEQEWYDLNEFSESFLTAFRVTVYKYQGMSTIQ